jgi:hypothetical protein
MVRVLVQITMAAQEDEPGLWNWAGVDAVPL